MASRQSQNGLRFTVHTFFIGENVIFLPYLSVCPSVTRILFTKNVLESSYFTATRDENIKYNHSCCVSSLHMARGLHQIINKILPSICTIITHISTSKCILSKRRTVTLRLPLRTVPVEEF